MPVPFPQALAALEASSDPARAAAMAAQRKGERRYLGVPAADIQGLAEGWREDLSVAERVTLAAGLWDTNIHEARLAAAKLLTQARIREDEPLVWREFLRWVPLFDDAAIADAACKAGERRLSHDPTRLSAVEGWIQDTALWTRRAALVVTLPWSKLTHPGPDARAERERILGWAAHLAPESNGPIQKAIAAWLRSLAKHDPARTRAFLAEHGPRLMPFAVREVARGLPAEMPG